MTKNKYVINDSTLIREWDWKKNKDVEPSFLTLGSGKKVWWICSKGHEWQATIASRNGGCGCPYCSGRKTINGYNDLQTVNPILVKEWNYEKNNGLAPWEVMPNSGKKIWWKCSKGHEWLATIAYRNAGGRCPICSNKKVLKGYNDLQTINPTLAKEWNYEKNNGLTPREVLSGSHKKVWWICSKGHEWQATIASRNGGCGCPICNSGRNTSFPEYAIMYYLNYYGIDFVHLYKEKGYELDIYIPYKKIAIEYDGYFWHKNKVKKDLEKNLKCKKDGIKLYRLREGLPVLNDSSLDYVIQRNQQDLSIIIKDVLSEITEISIDVDLEKDLVAIENLREFIEKEKSLLVSNFKIASEWNYNKNGKLRPEFFSPNSSKKVWWKCSKGHEWKSTIGNRNRGNGCPYCSGRIAIKGYNDLQTINSALAKEWNYEKNNGLTPSDIFPNINKKVWWKCSKGHEWQATPNHRNNGQDCPYCSGQKILKGYNDLQTLKPILTKEWNYDKNLGLTPEKLSAGSHKKVWWKCSKGHEWQATIESRNRGNGCPYCSGRIAIKGYNDLQTVNPALASEWNYEKNNGLLPSEVMPNSSIKVWWECSKGHEWESKVVNRNNGIGCPICSNKKVLKGYNDLQTINPTLAKEWNYEKNNGLTPREVLSGSHKKVWWKCAEGHEWQAVVGSRNVGKGCPICYQNSRKKKKLK